MSLMQCTLERPPGRAEESGRISGRGGGRGVHVRVAACVRPFVEN